MNSKWKSRKFWLAIVGAALVIANEGLDMNLDRETVLAFAAIIIGYIFAEASVDKNKLA